MKSELGNGDKYMGKRMDKPFEDFAKEWVEQDNASGKVEGRDKIVREGIAIVLITLSLPYQDTWQKQLKKKKRIYSGPQLGSVVLHDGKGMVAAAQGTWPHCTHSQEVEKREDVPCSVERREIGAIKERNCLLCS